ncbi:PHD finger protein ALFIN-LIKE 1-like [Carya illinoinensis]|uniref:PHD finger protein ALFIN-LIKE 1-like n=1 Tax=Carya illinoinensis TaxID=32201 RepID=UPI001C718E84|nr:PHD finger protein ALFIN-LIKE 1-like [Carya illinoinensis]
MAPLLRPRQRGTGIMLCLKTKDINAAFVKVMSARVVVVSENRKDWLSLVAMHNDFWLLSLAFYLGVHLNRNERKHLFSLINDLHTIFEVMKRRKPMKVKPIVDSRNKSRGFTKRSIDGQVKNNPKHVEEIDVEEDNEHNETLSGSCGGDYSA